MSKKASSQQLQRNRNYANTKLKSAKNIIKRMFQISLPQDCCESQIFKAFLQKTRLKGIKTSIGMGRTLIYSSIHCNEQGAPDQSWFPDKPRAM